MKQSRKIILHPPLAQKLSLCPLIFSLEHSSRLAPGKAVPYFLLAQDSNQGCTVIAIKYDDHAC